MDVHTLILALAFIFSLTLVALVAIAAGKDQIAKDAVGHLGRFATKALKVITRAHDHPNE